MPSLFRVVSTAYLKRPEPISLVHFLTNRCTARCRHCFIDFDAPGIFRGELSTDEIRRVAAHLGPSLLNVNLTGGEPFLRADLYEIARAYFDLAKVRSVYLTTHGGFPERIQAFLEGFARDGLPGQLILSFSIDNFEEAHDQNRRLPGLYRKALESYRLVREAGNPKMVSNIAITVTDHNHAVVDELYTHLKEREGVQAITAIAMREEGVVQGIPPETKAAIAATYRRLTRRILEDQDRGETAGYRGSLIGGMLNAKNRILYDLVCDTYLEPRYVSPCPAGALFVVIGAKGEVYPCEVLEGRCLGNLKDFDYDLLALLQAPASRECRTFIRDTQCNCTYECALGINILANPLYGPRLAAGLARTWGP